MSDKIQLIRMEAEEKIIKAMMLSPYAVHRYEEELGYMMDLTHTKLANMIIKNTKKNGRCYIDELFAEADEGTRKWLEEFKREEEDVMTHAIRAVKIGVLAKEAEAYRYQLKNDTSEESRDIIMKGYFNCIKEMIKYCEMVI